MPIYPISNKFLKGLKNTIDPKMFDSQSWTFPTENIRIMNLKGQGYVVSIMPSNSNPNSLQGEEFRLTDGFQAIGACDWNGIAYIFSYNVTTNEGEIGCYPAPDITGTQFVGYSTTTIRKYSPLRNFKVSGNFVPFRTTKFGFFDSNENRVRMVQCFARLDYDQSVNIYFVDYNNVDRVVNSGFNQEGISTGRFYTDTNFNNYIPLIPQTTVLSTITASINSGGSLKYGLYYVFLRYVTSDYNRTPFYLQSGSLQVYQGTSDIYNAQGGLYNNNSDKKISVTLTSLDTDYAYYELAYIRYYTDSNNPLQYECGLIDKYFAITELTPEIFNNTSITPIIIDEIVTPPSKEIVSKSITQNENICFKCNVKEFNTHHESLKEIAWRVLPFTYVLPKQDETVFENAIGVSTMEYKDATLKYNVESYFGGEIYAFGIVFGFDGGYESDVYPIRGIDNWLGTVSAPTDYAASPSAITNSTENLNGIYRFPNRCITAYQLYYEDGASSYVQHLSPMFDFTQAKTYINASTGLWFRNNVRYIRIVRTDRKECLIGQGLSMAMATTTITAANVITDECCFTDVGSTSTKYVPWVSDFPTQPYTPGRWSEFDEGKNAFWGTVKNNGTYGEALRTSAFAPLYRGYIPMVMYNHNSGTDTSRCYIDRMSLVYNKYAIYCPDFILSGMNKDTTNIIKIMSIGHTVFSSGSNDNWLTRNTIDPLQTIHYQTSEEGNNVIFPIYDISEMDKGLYSKSVAVKTIQTKWVGIPSTVYPSSNPVTLNGHDYYNCAYDNSVSNDHILLMDYSQNNSLGSEDWCSNRNIYLLPYLACEVVESEATTNHENLNIVNLYNIDPIGITGTSFKEYYNIDSEKYYEITFNAIVMVYNINNHITLADQSYYFRGDCHIQRTYFKQMTWQASQLHLTDGSSTAIGVDYDRTINRGCADYPDAGGYNDCQLYAHGLVLGIITENKVNTAMRIDNIAGGNTYYPKNHNDAFWPVKPFVQAYAESFIANHGYDVCHSNKYWNLYNRTMPFNEVIHPTRIRHSYANTPGEFTDGYRQWDIASYVDFDSDGGEMFKILSHRKTLISVQKYVANQHYSNQEQQKVASNTGELIVGTGPVLSQNVRKFNFGTQHIDSVIVTDEGVYGVDALRRCIWNIKLTTTQMGSSLFAGGNISQEKEVETRLFEILEGYYTKTDVISQLNYPDTNFNSLGIYTWPISKYNEVVFTFLNVAKCTTGACDVWIIENIYGKGTIYEWITGTNYRLGTVLYCETLDNNNNVLTAHFYYHHPDSEGHYNQHNTVPPAVNALTADPEWTIVDVNNIVEWQNNTVYDSNTIGYIDCCNASYTYAFAPEQSYLFHIVGQPLIQPDPDHPMVLLEYNYTTHTYSTSDASDWIYVDRTDTNRLKINCKCNSSTSLVWNEKLGMFISEIDIKPYTGFNINSETYTFLPTEYLTTGQCYLNDRSDNGVLSVWNHNKEAIISWIVNGLGEQDMSKLNKQFLSYNIIGSELGFTSIEYITDMQISIHDWAEYYWCTPDYFENEWRVPILSNTVQSSNGEYSIESNMVGHYLKVSLSYKGRVDGFIKEIVTNFAISFA